LNRKNLVLFSYQNIGVFEIISPIRTNFSLATFKKQRISETTNKRTFLLPISQTLSLNPVDCTLFILKPCVGVI